MHVNLHGLVSTVSKILNKILDKIVIEFSTATFQPLLLSFLFLIPPFTLSEEHRYSRKTND